MKPETSTVLHVTCSFALAAFPHLNELLAPIAAKCCKACMREFNRARRSTLRGHVQECLNTAKTNSKKRGQEFSLSLLQVLDMLEQQSGRCFYSGVPLEYKRIHTPWRLSIERLNNSIGYTMQNCVLIAIEFNTADQSRNKRGVIEVFGTAQWSREKVAHIWGDHGWATKGVPGRPNLQVDRPNELNLQLDHTRSQLTDSSSNPVLGTLNAAFI